MFTSHPCPSVPLGLALGVCLAQSRKSLAAPLPVTEQSRLLIFQPEYLEAGSDLLSCTLKPWNSSEASQMFSSCLVSLVCHLHTLMKLLEGKSWVVCGTSCKGRHFYLHKGGCKEKSTCLRSTRTGRRSQSSTEELVPISHLQTALEQVTCQEVHFPPSQSSYFCPSFSSDITSSE